MLEEIKQKALESENRHKEEMWELGKQYAKFLFEQTGIKEGDIVIDDCGNRILFERVGLNVNSRVPYQSDFRLIGKKLRVDNTPRKDNSSETIYCTRIEKVIKNHETII